MRMGVFRRPWGRYIVGKNRQNSTGKFGKKLPNSWMASPADSVTIAPRGREARHAVAVPDRRRDPRRGREPGGRLVAPRDARVAARAQRAVPGPARRAGRGAHRPGEPAVAGGGGAVARARGRGAAARRDLSLPAGGRGLRGPATLAPAGAPRRG